MIAVYVTSVDQSRNTENLIENYSCEIVKWLCSDI